MTAANGPRRSRKRIHRSARLPCQPSLSHPAKATTVLQRAFCLTASVSVAGEYSRVHTPSPPSSSIRSKLHTPPIPPLPSPTPKSHLRHPQPQGHPPLLSSP